MKYPDTELQDAAADTIEALTAERDRLKAEVEILSDAEIPPDPDEDSDGTVCCRDARAKWDAQRERAEAAETKLAGAKVACRALAAELKDMLSARDAAEARAARLEEALRSIAANTCCDGCQEAARVAQAALAQETQP